MNIVNTNYNIDELINKNEMVLVYFGSEDCGVCQVIKPKIKEILKSYPKIKSVEVDIKSNPWVSSSYSIFTMPVILVFIQGKETIREARNISMQDIDNKIARYYGLLFE